MFQRKVETIYSDEFFVNFFALVIPNILELTKQKLVEN